MPMSCRYLINKNTYYTITISNSKGKYIVFFLLKSVIDTILYIYNYSTYVPISSAGGYPNCFLINRFVQPILWRVQTMLRLAPETQKLPVDVHAKDQARFANSWQHGPLELLGNFFKYLVFLFHMRDKFLAWEKENHPTERTQTRLDIMLTLRDHNNSGGAWSGFKMQFQVCWNKPFEIKSSNETPRISFMFSFTLKKHGTFLPHFRATSKPNGSIIQLLPHISHGRLRLERPHGTPRQPWCRRTKENGIGGKHGAEWSKQTHQPGSNRIYGKNRNQNKVDAKKMEKQHERFGFTKNHALKYLKLGLIIELGGQPIPPCLAS